MKLFFELKFHIHLRKNPPLLFTNPLLRKFNENTWQLTLHKIAETLYSTF